MPQVFKFHIVFTLSRIVYYRHAEEKVSATIALAIAGVLIAACVVVVASATHQANNNRKQISGDYTNDYLSLTYDPMVYDLNDSKFTQNGNIVLSKKVVLATVKRLVT